MSLTIAANDLVRALSRLTAIADAFDTFADLADAMNNSDTSHAYRLAARDIRNALSGHRCESLSPEMWRSVKTLQSLLPADPNGGAK